MISDRLGQWLGQGPHGAVAREAPPAAPGAVREGPLGGWPKRALDLAFAIVGLLVAAPLMLAIAALIAILDPGPVLFAHDRVGFGGRSFRCYKFRTMAVNGGEILARHLAADPDAAREWRETRKLRCDPRVGPLGSFLRRTSLDELPQLFNILLGDMSCVGPRPIVTDELERYGASTGDYLRARPGLTGIWQVTGRSSAEYATRVLLDTGYVRGWSLRGDLLILCRTPLALLRFDEAC